MKDYSQYTEDDFLSDEHFQNWVLGRCEPDEKLFWESFIERFPEKRLQIESASYSLKNIYRDEDKVNLPSDEQIEKSFQKVSRILGLRKQKTKRTKILLLKGSGWVAAASILLIFSYWLLTNKDGGRLVSKAETKTSTPVQDLKPGGDRAVLTLSDGTQILLDSVENGQIAAQGNTKVFKLQDGQISYRGNKGSHTGVFYNTITTPSGGQYQMVLSDGTKVWLNAESSLQFPMSFNEKDRRVTLKGEGYFEVVHDENHPFIVSANGMDVKVLGTKFNIKSYDDGEDTKTTLVQGRVEVRSGNKDFVLSPRQQAQLNNKDGGLSVINNVDLEEVIAWKNGFFQFNNAQLDVILKEAARWYGADIIYDGKIHDLFTGAVPRNDDVMDLLHILEATNKVKFKVIGKQIIVK